ncbi:MAG: hypothetical protein PHX83_11975 [Acidobacteriia bacterium]|nr:hypothetical protein [Terriglobia bacterium]
MSPILKSMLKRFGRVVLYTALSAAIQFLLLHVPSIEATGVWKILLTYAWVPIAGLLTALDKGIRDWLAVNV